MGQLVYSEMQIRDCSFSNDPGYATRVEQSVSKRENERKSVRERERFKGRKAGRSPAPSEISEGGGEAGPGDSN